MAFDEFSFGDLQLRSISLHENIAAAETELRRLRDMPEAIEHTFVMAPVETPKSHKKWPEHRRTILITQENVDDTWNMLVDSFKRRFNRKKYFEIKIGSSWLRVGKDKYFKAKDRGQEVKKDWEDRWSSHEWNEINKLLQPSMSDDRTIGDFKKLLKNPAHEEQIRGVAIPIRNEVNRINAELGRRENFRNVLDTVAQTDVDYVRDLPLSSVMATFHLKGSDKNIAKQFKKGELELDDVVEHLKTYMRVD